MLLYFSGFALYDVRSSLMKLTPNWTHLVIMEFHVLSSSTNEMFLFNFSYLRRIQDSATTWPTRPARMRELNR